MDKYNDIEKKIVGTFIDSVKYMSAKDAILSLDHKIFVEHAKEFNALTEDEQMEVRRVMLALKLVHV